ncbi:MAG: bifunctional 4-hydroxy-2-oxoglutarate aldolase/2-dehydro-3-deoxy-phosphogluconate aldolase [Terrimicrobiaceae bacterium]|nr:bifunctional 4-hydroxy-2-oxoglutarate aldolase/2-dehydro-3-deoxy-phosphogluconate aldolase [Terrimicrobiaceae bacterium]
MSQAFDSELATRIESFGVIAVLVVDRADDAIPLARALLDGGVGVMELALRTSAAPDALKSIRASVPGMIVGVGTILTPAQVQAAKEAGAAFGVAPGTNGNVLAAARAAGLSFAPGIATPSDIETALDFECRMLKFFPSEPSGGLAYLKNIAAPYAHLGLKYIPLGGVNEKNMAAYLGDPIIGALGGSWLAPRDLIKAADWSAITARCAAAAEIIKSTRKAS